MKKHWKYLLFQICMSILLVFVVKTAVDERGGLSDNSDYMDSLWSYTEISSENPFTQHIILDRDKLKAVEIFAGPDMGGNTLSVEVYCDEKKLTGGAVLTENTLYDQWYRIVLNDNLIGVDDRELALVISASAPMTLVNVAPTANLTNPDTNVGTVLFYDYKSEGRYIAIASLIAILIWLLLSTALYLWPFGERMRPHHFFAIAYAVLGLMYFFMVPMSGVADEPHHFFRAYEISEGHFVSKTNELGEAGDMLPANLGEGMTQRSTTYAEERDAFGIERSDERAFLEFENTTLYSPLSYLPQALGILVGRIFTHKTFLLAYFGRFFALAFIGWVLQLCVKYIPVGKEILIATALLPINLQECMSLAADGLAFAMVTAFVSYVLYLRYSKEIKIGGRQTAVLLALAIMVASCKVVYLPVVLCVFLIPKEKFESKAACLWKGIFVCLVSGMISLVWLVICRSFLPGGDTVNSGAQLWYILQNPLNYLAVIARTHAKYAVFWLQQLFCGAMGYMDIPCGNDVVLLTAGTYLWILLQSQVEVEDKKWHVVRMVAGGTAVCVVMLTLTSLYLQWTPVGTAWIAGFQGRYYIPLLLPATLALKTTKGTPAKGCPAYTWPLMALVNLMALATMVTRYIF